MGLRLTLGYLTSGINTITSQTTLSLVSLFTHLNGTCLPKTSVSKTFDTGIKLYSSKPVTQTIGSDTTCWENPKGETPGRSHKNENKSPIHKGMTPPSTQNLKTLGLWIFFIICCSTFSFLVNVRLRLTLGYLTRSHMDPSSFERLVLSWLLLLYTSI